MVIPKKQRAPLDEILKEDYLPIEDYAPIFSNRTTALVGKTGSIDWGCFPNVDSDPVFFSLLDKRKGGFFRIMLKGEGVEASQKYVGENNILETSFYRDGRKELSITDFLPTVSEPNIYFSEIHRIVKAYSDATVSLDFFPFGDSASAATADKRYGYVVSDGERHEFLSTDARLVRKGSGFSGALAMKEGERRNIVAAFGVSKPFAADGFQTMRRLQQTKDYWHRWLGNMRYNGYRRDSITRSALALKGLFFSPTGFMVAAPTTSLPESIGGTRNWDYRYTWIRDTAYVIDTMLLLGFKNEASRFLYSVIDRIEREGKVDTIYPVSRKRMGTEIQESLEGYMHSAPVRLGNAAASQFQLDQYAALIDAVRIFMDNDGIVNMHMWTIIRDLVEKIVKLWHMPDNSIWEIRAQQRDYVYSKALTWKALLDAAQIAQNLGIERVFRESIRSEAAAVRAEIEKRGVSENGDYYVQYYGGKGVDGALLRLPLIGYANPKSRRFVNTLREVEKRLMKEDFLFRRYDEDDGMGEDNGFLLLSFWYIEDLILIGDHKRAEEGLKRIMNYTNDVGILPEEIEFGSHRYLGNYPQALSHLSFVSALLKYNKYVLRKRKM